MKKFLLFLLILTILSIYSLPILKSKAHPMPYIIQTFNWGFYEDKVTLDYYFSMEPLATERFYPLIDEDKSGDISDSEMNRFSSTITRASYGRLNNKDIELEKKGYKTLKPDEILSFENAIEIKYEVKNPKLLETNSFMFEFKKKWIPEDPAGDMIVFGDNFEENGKVSRISSNEETLQDKIVYTVDYKISEYKEPIAASQSKGNPVSRFFDWTTETSKKLSGNIFNTERKGIGFILFAFVAIFIAGALHAVTPGHGKSMMTAFHVGKGKSKSIDVFILAASITLAHTIVIFALGFTLLFLKKTEMINKIIPYFEKASAALLIVLAFTLLRRAYNNYKHYRYHKIHGDHHHEHGHDHHTQEEANETDHDELHVKDIEHQHGHTHHWENVKIRNKWDLFVAGTGGGIVPCVDALSLLILSVHLGKVGWGLILTFIFSLGLAGAIVLIGLLFVYGQNKFDFEKRFGNVAEIYSPLFTGLLIAVYALKFIF